jgi:hypothetical protein
MQFRTCKNHNVGQRRNLRTVSLLDPVFKSGLLEIPIEKTLPTKGRDEWMDGRLNKDLSLCCLFQKGRCHAQERCYQVHVDRDYMTSLREQQENIVSCCRNCKDTASLSAPSMTFFSSNMATAKFVEVSYPNGAVRVVDAKSIAYTAGLVQQFDDHGAKVTAEGILEIPARRICRLHTRGCCKYGKDCKNVHACIKIGEKILVAPTIQLAASAPTPVPQPPEVAEKVVVEIEVPRLQAHVSPPMTSFAPVTVITNPLGFGICNRNAKSMSAKSLDAVDLCEHSARMLKSFLFDAAMALEDSSAEPAGSFLDDSSSLGNTSDDAVSLLSAYSPGQKRAAPHTLHLDAFHPCSRAEEPFGACRISSEQWSMVAMFA